MTDQEREQIKRGAVCDHCGQEFSTLEGREIGRNAQTPSVRDAAPIPRLAVVDSRNRQRPGPSEGWNEMSLILQPITLREAHAFVAKHHRHHGPSRGGLFAVAASDSDGVVAVAVVGRPVARLAQGDWTAEVTRLCSTGARNACSMLYAAAWRAARALGYRRLITYTLETEPGASLRAAGWKLVGKTKGGTWGRVDRPRVDTHPLQAKLRWEAA